MTGEVVCIAWKTDVMPAHSFTYGHRACLLEKGPRQNQEIRELTQDDLLPTMMCHMCGEVLHPAGRQGCRLKPKGKH